MRPDSDFDHEDAKILKRRQAAFERQETPQLGDYVRFADGVERRISHVWGFHGGGIQTSDGRWGMSFYLGDDSYVEFSGGLYGSVPPETLKLTDERKKGRFWFFHHGWVEAYNGIGVWVPCRVWQCSQEAPN